VRAKPSPVVGERLCDYVTVPAKPCAAVCQTLCTARTRWGKTIRTVSLASFHPTRPTFCDRALAQRRLQARAHTRGER